MGTTEKEESRDLALIPEEALREIEAERSVASDYARALIVDSAESYIEAGEYVVRIARAKFRIHELTDPICTATHNAHKAATRQRSELLFPLEADERVISSKAITWKQQQDRLAADAALKAQREADRKADEDRRALQAKAEAVGDTSMARALGKEIGKPAAFVSAPAVETAPRVAGLTARENWIGRERPNGLRALICAAAADPSLDQYLCAAMPRINQRAKSQRESFDLPGFEAVNTLKLSGRR